MPYGMAVIGVRTGHAVHYMLEGHHEVMVAPHSDVADICGS